MKLTQQAVKVAADLGLKKVSAHIGFVPPSSDPNYAGMLGRICEVGNDSRPQARRPATRKRLARSFAAVLFPWRSGLSKPAQIVGRTYLSDLDSAAARGN